MALLQLVRWKNLMLVFLTQVFVFVFLSDNITATWQADLFPFLLVCASTLLLTAGGYVINDYSDIGIDAVNKPNRLIVGRLIPRRHVLVLHVMLNLTGVVLALMVNRWFFMACVVVAFALWRYSVDLKYRFFLGNLTVALLMSLSLLVLAYASKDIMVIWLSFYTFFAFITGLIREIIKDIEDMDGDRQYGCLTLPIVLGIFKTKVILYYLFLASQSLLILSIVYLFYQKYIILPIYLLTVVSLPLFLLFFRLVHADNKKEFSRLSRWIKLIMVAGVLSMALRNV